MGGERVRRRTDAASDAPWTIRLTSGKDSLILISWRMESLEVDALV